MNAYKKRKTSYMFPIYNDTMKSHSKTEEQGQRRGIADQSETETELGKH